jgi:hypothetical protein
MKKRIIAYKTILENMALGTIFLASKGDERTQCAQPTQQHIVWAGELDVPAEDPEFLLREFVAEQDDIHLSEKLEDFLRRKIGL